MSKTAVPAPTLTQTEKDQLKAIFDDFDKDHSGELSIEELRAVLNSFLQKKPSDRQLKRIFSSADIDKNGSIDFNEFVNAMNKTRTDEFTERKAVFDILDIDHNGSIDASEFTKACAQLGLTLTQTELDVLFENYDLNGDKVIDFSEFCTLLTALG
jgi:calmodulin